MYNTNENIPAYKDGEESVYFTRYAARFDWVTTCSVGGLSLTALKGVTTP